MSNIDLRLGDNLEILKTMQDNSVDSIVTDPPYGIKFMGKKWDYDIPSVELWQEVIRVLKPGGHALVACGTRTQHRMAVNLEDAGFEIRDIVAWVYGCYSADTEVLTNNGWKHYKELSELDKVLQWDKDTNELSWITPLNKFEYEIQDEMVLLENRNTSQLITKEHSVYAKIRKHSRNKKSHIFEKIKACDIKEHWVLDLPLAGKMNGKVNEKNAYLIGWWLTDAWKHADGKAVMFSQSKKHTLKKLKDYFDSMGVNYSEYIKKPKLKTHNPEHTLYVTGEIADFLLTNYNDREMKWEMLNWDLQSRTLLMEGLMDGDGSIRKGSYSRVFWSLNRERLDMFQALCLSLNMRSHIDYVKGCVYFNTKRNTTQIQYRHRKPLQKYEGKVWCLQTETGAFVVRRNGKAFISGNSGFPKSYNISKAIEAIEKTGKSNSVALRQVEQEGDGEAYTLTGKNNGILGETRVYDRKEYTPGTENSKKWEGWGTALKPAMELWTLCRKPLGEKTIAKNVLKYGTGGINIDECRVETKDKLQGSTSTKMKFGGNAFFESSTINDPNWQQNAGGRFPANLIHDGSEEVLSCFPDTKSQGHWSKTKTTGFGKFGNGKSEYLGVGEKDKISGNASRFFKECNFTEEELEEHQRLIYCAKASKKERNLGLESFPKKQKVFNGQSNTSSTDMKDVEKRFTTQPAQNNHPTVKPVELMRYLCRLITPKGGIILDPYMGSGSTGIAAKLEGLNFIGIEREEDYFEIARARIDYWEKEEKE